MPRRVAALLAPPPRLRLLLLAAAIVLVAISGAAALEAARNLHQLIELAQAPAAEPQRSPTQRERVFTRESTTVRRAATVVSALVATSIAVK